MTRSVLGKHSDIVLYKICTRTRTRLFLVKKKNAMAEVVTNLVSFSHNDCSHLVKTKSDAIPVDHI